LNQFNRPDWDLPGWAGFILSGRLWQAVQSRAGVSPALRWHEGFQGNRNGKRTLVRSPTDQKVSVFGFFMLALRARWAGGTPALLWRHHEIFLRAGLTGRAFP